jgi:response regulator RpfG family c-di-GMP phosphodiesterase
LNIIVVEDDQDIREMIAITFEMYFQVDCKTFSDVESAKRYIQKNALQIDLIMSDLHMPKQGGADLYQYLIDHKINIPFVLMTAGSIEDISVFNNKSYLHGIIEKPNVVVGIQKIIKELQTSLVHDGLPASEFVPIGLNLLLTLKTLPCDSYIQMSSSKVLKYFSSNDRFTKKDQLNLLQKNIQELYIERENLPKILSILAEMELDISPTASHLYEFQNVIHKTINELQINTHLYAFGKKQVNAVLKNIEQNPEIQSILKRFVSQDENFACSHSLLLAYICNFFNYYFESEPFFHPDALIYASIMHDLCIKDLAIIEFEHLDDGLIESNHPQKCGEFIKRDKQFPAQVAQIIEMHHEKFDGSGFPHGLAHKNLPSLPSLFIFCHELVNEMYRLKKNGSLTNSNLKKSMQEKQSPGVVYATCLKALESMNLID